MFFGPFSGPEYSKCRWDLGHDAGLHIMNVPNHQATTLAGEIAVLELERQPFLSRFSAAGLNFEDYFSV